MKRKNTIRVLCLACFVAVLMFSSCEKEKEYTSMSYINKEAVFNDTVNPVENIAWINRIYKSIAGSESLIDYQALISFVANGDSTQSIYCFWGKYVDLYRYDGKIYNLEVQFGDTTEIAEVHRSILSAKTYEYVHRIINEALNGNNKNDLEDYNKICTKMPEDNDYDPFVDSILYSATNIDLLYCSKKIEL